MLQLLQQIEGFRVCELPHWLKDVPGAWDGSRRALFCRSETAEAARESALATLHADEVILDRAAWLCMELGEFQH